MPLTNGTIDAVAISRAKVTHSQLPDFVIAAEVLDGSTTN
jgi:hypothetical protein